MGVGDEVQQGVVAAPVQGVVVSQPVQQGVVVGAQPAMYGVMYGGAATPAQSYAMGTTPNVAPPGRWLAPCMPNQGCPMCLMAVFCRCVYIAQLHERVVKRQSFQSVLGVLVGVQVLGYIVSRMGANIAWTTSEDEEVAGSGEQMWNMMCELAVALVYLKYVITIRRQMRARDHIQDGSGACGSECCTSYFCQLCVLCQMFAHDNQLKGLGSPSCDFSPMGMNGRQNYPLVEGEHVV